MDDWKDIKERLIEALFVSQLTQPDVGEINVLIEAGEFQVALEFLCTQIFERELEPTAEQRRDLESLGQQLEVSVPRLLGDPWAT